MIDFPFEERRFAPMGMSIYKNYLYVINMGYDKGGERIEQF